jgi:S1/P1 Nuclease
MCFRSGSLGDDDVTKSCYCLVTGVNGVHPMRRLRALSVTVAFLAAPSNYAQCWWDEGHMQIAYVAYKHLDAQVRERVDVLLRLNKDYPKWTAGVRDEATSKLYAFVHAATWADDIKTKEYGYTRDSVDSPTAGQNIGYVDHNQHAYWHFKDTNFSPDNTPLPASDPVNLVTQLKLLFATLPASSGARMI